MTQELSKTQIRYKYVDSREPEDIRMKLMETGWMQSQLSCGDFWFFDVDYKKVGIERKSVDDFLASIGDRLANQIERCLDSYDVVILMLEGNWRKAEVANNIMTGRGTNYNTWAMAWNFIRSQQHKGVTIEITLNPGHTIQRLNELYAWYQSSSHTGGMSHKTFIDDRIMAFPKGCRGKTAEEVLKIFKALRYVGNADVEDLMHVDGVGQKKAQAIFDHFRTSKSNSVEYEEVNSVAESLIIDNTSSEENIEGQGKLL